MARYKQLVFEKRKKPDEFVSLVDAIVTNLAPFKGIIVSLVLLVFVASFIFLFLNLRNDSALTTVNGDIFKASQSNKPLEDLEKLALDNDGKSFNYLSQIELVSLYSTKMQFDKLPHSYTKIIESAPTQIKKHYALSYAYFLAQDKKWDESLKVLDEAGDSLSDGDREFKTYLKARVLIGQGKPDEGFKLLKELAATGKGTFKKKALESYILEQVKGKAGNV